MSFTLTFHGAARTVTGSCIHVQYGITQILVDCGMQQENDSDEVNEKFLFDPSQINAVILTHGHLDHTGKIPLLVQAGFKGIIYGHYATCEIAKIIWNDSVKFLSGTGLSYHETTVATTCQKLIPIGYNVPMQIKDVCFTLRDAGHILGSSHILMEGEGKKILFSGDIGPVNTPIIRDSYRKWDSNVDAVVIESTYGNRIHKDRTDTILEFQNIVQRTISTKGVLLIPAFAIGRTQEILYHLNTLVEEKSISPIPVFVDSPMADLVTGIYRRHRDCYDSETCAKITNGDMPLEFKGLSFALTPAQSVAIKEVRPPFIVVAGSGMCNGGRILGHMVTFAPHPSTSIMFVGWQGAGTAGRKLIDGAKQIDIEGKSILVNARIETLNGFSAHADQNGLLDWARAIPGRPKLWFVNHGEESQACELAQVLERELGGKAVAVEKMRFEV
jgi:metallo-beta-lactamase family protein